MTILLDLTLMSRNVSSDLHVQEISDQNSVGSFFEASRALNMKSNKMVIIQEERSMGPSPFPVVITSYCW